MPLFVISITILDNSKSKTLQTHEQEASSLRSSQTQKCAEPIKEKEHFTEIDSFTLLQTNPNLRYFNIITDSKI